MIEESRKDTLRSRKVVRFILVLLISMLIALVLVRMGIGVRVATILPIERVQIFGNSSVTNGEIARLIGLDSEHSLLFFSRERAMRLLRQDARIERVEVVKVYPDTLRIFIAEKERGAALEHAEKLYWLSQDGVVLSAMDERSPGDYPFITFLSDNDDIKTGYRVENSMLLNLLEEVLRFRKDYPEFFRFVDSFSVDDSGITVYLHDARYRVYLGSSVTKDKLKRLRALQIVLQTIHPDPASKKKVFEIDMSFSHAAVREGELFNEL